MSRKQNFDNQEYFNFTKSFDDFFAQVQADYETIPDNYYIKRYANNWTDPDEDFVGSDDADLLNSKLTEFIDNPRLDTSIEKIKNLFSLISLGGAFDKDRMVATDLPIGVFDFSLASQGLYKPQEYYCEFHKTLISENLVTKTSSKPDIFTHVAIINGIKKTLIVKQQQKGTFAVQQMEAYVEELVKVGEDKMFAQELARAKYPKAKLKFSTKTKKINLIRRSKTLKNNKVGNDKYVDIFVKIGGNSNENARTLLYRTMPSLLVAFFLDKAGIKTRVLGLESGRDGFPSSTKNDFFRYMNTFVIKEYEDGFDFNDIAILTADVRTFRWKMFKSIGVTFAKAFNYDIGSSLGSAIDGDLFYEIFERYKQYYIQEQKQNTGIKNLNSRLMLTSALTVSGSDSDTEIMVAVENEFFRLMDALDIEFNGSAQALPRIKTRELARGIDISTLRSRIIGSIATITVTDNTDSKFTTTDEQINIISELKKKLIADANEVYKSI